jgi:hypothetical protein
MSEDIALKITSEADLAAVDRTIGALQEIQAQGGNLSASMEGTAGACNDLRGQMLGAVQSLDDMKSESNDAAKGLEEVGTGLNETRDAAGRAAQGIQGMMVVHKVFGFLRQGAQLFGESLKRMADSGDKDAQRVLGQIEDMKGGWERFVDKLSEKVLIPVLDFETRNYVYLFSLLGDGMDETRRKARELNLAWDDLRQEGAANVLLDQAQAAQTAAQHIANVERATGLLKERDVGLLDLRVPENISNLGTAAGRAALAMQELATSTARATWASAVVEGWVALNDQVQVASQKTTDYLAQDAQQRADDAQKATLDIRYWEQDQNRFLRDNAAKLTPELAAEFRKRTAAVKKEADECKEYDAQEANELLQLESTYQQEKLRIATDPKLTDEERAAKLAALDEDQAMYIQRVKEQAGQREDQARESLQRQIEDARAAGAAGGKAFMDALSPEGMAQRLQGFKNIFDKFVQSGQRMPVAEAADYKNALGDIGTAIAKLDVPDYVKTALLQMLQEAELLLGKISQSSTTYADNMDRAGQAPRPGWTPPPEYQSAGEIKRTGPAIVHRGEIWYNPGEVGGGSGYQEAMRKGRGIPTAPSAPTLITVQLVVDGRVLAETVARYVGATR